MSPFETLLTALKTDALLQRDGAETLYAQLAGALTEAIRSGALRPGDRLPPHRELASELGINITTVTRAMAVLQEQGLIESRPGRGTQVAQPRQPAVQFQSAPSDAPGLIDLSVNRPATDAYNKALAGLLPRLVSDPRFIGMKDYHPSEGMPWAREAAAHWLRALDVPAQAANLVITEGAQHGIACILRAMTVAGDTVLADSITYQGINALCRSLGLNLVGVDGDARGMNPQALSEAIETHGPRLLFLVPSIHNPTAITLDAQRRAELLAVMEPHDDLWLIEDDVYRPLLEQRDETFIARRPQRTFYVTALSKCIAPGLRMGFVVAPPAQVQNIAATLRIDCWSTSPLNALIATRLIEERGSEELIAHQREELRARQALLAAHLEGLRYQASDVGTHAWLHLPEPWNASRFARLCQEQGVGVLPGGAFSLRQDQSPNAVRINLSAAKSREQLVQALDVIARLAQQGHLHMHDRV